MDCTHTYSFPCFSRNQANFFVYFMRQILH
jgi:hypothetical protein